MISSESELPPCPVAFDQLMDGLLGALGWFERAYERICQRADMELITRQEYRLLRMIARYAENMRSPRPSELAKALGVGQPYVTRLGRALVQERLVIRGGSRGDGRVNAFELTEDGALVASADDLGEFFWEMLVSELGKDAAGRLAEAICYLERRPLV